MRDPEIRYHRILCTVDKDVFRLQVPVPNPLAVGKLQALENAQEHFESFSRGDGTADYPPKGLRIKGHDVKDRLCAPQFAGSAIDDLDDVSMARPLTK